MCVKRIGIQSKQHPFQMRCAVVSERERMGVCERVALLNEQVNNLYFFEVVTVNPL